MTMPWSAARESVCVCRGSGRRRGGAAGGCCRFAYGQTNSLNCRCLHQHTYTRSMQIDEREKERESDWERQEERQPRTILGAATPRFRFCVCFLVYLVAPLGLCFVLCSLRSLYLSLSPNTHIRRHTRALSFARQIGVWLWLWLWRQCNSFFTMDFY